MPALIVLSRRRRAIVALASIVLASAFHLPAFAVAEEEPEPTDDSEAQGQIPPAADTADRPAQAERKGTSVTATMPADSGVAVQTLCTNCNNANLSIAGMGNEHVSLIVDGIPVPAGLPQIYLLSVMPPSRMNKISVSKGAGSADFLGAAVGGGIQVEMMEPKQGYGLNASADHGSFGWNSAKLDWAGRSDVVGGHVVGTWSESDSIDANNDGWPDLPEFERLTAELGLDIVPSKAHRLRFGANLYDEDQVDGPAGPFYYVPRICRGLDQVIFGAPCFVGEPGVGYNREDVKLNRQQFEGLYDLALESGTKLSLTGQFGKRDQDIQETLFEGVDVNILSQGDLDFIEENFGLTEEELRDLGFQFFREDELGSLDPSDVEMDRFPAYAIEDEVYQGAATVSQTIGHQTLLRGGVAVFGQSFNVVDYILNHERDYPAGTQLEEEVIERGVWFEGGTALGSRLELSVGARYIDFEYTDNEAEIAEFDSSREPWLAIPLPEGNRLVPRAALTWKVVDSVQMRFSAGAGLRAPPPAFDRVCCGRRFRGNRGVLLEESESAGFEITYQPGPRWRVGGSFFQTNFDNLILNMSTKNEAFLPQTGAAIQAVRTYQNVNIPEARNRSANVEARFQAPVWMTTTLSYSWLDPENLAPEKGISALVDTGGTPEPITFHYQGIPYTITGQGALGFDFALPPRSVLSLVAQYTGPMLIQRFATPSDRDDPDFDRKFLDGVGTALAETEEFWVANVRFNKDFRNGLTVYAGVDNVLDYVQGHGCTIDQAALNPNLVGCLGDPSYDYNWGPLRGRYYYAGLGYSFTR